LLYEKLAGFNVKANITVLQDRYLMNNVCMNLADGSLDMKGNLISIAKGKHRATLNADMRNVNVQKIFYAFENFGQDGITDKSIQGNLTVHTDISIDLADDGKVLPASSMGEVKFS
jgi:hypothetical protein